MQIPFLSQLQQVSLPGRIEQVNALKVGSLALIVLIIGIIIQPEQQIATLMLMGIIAGGLSDTPSHYRSRALTFILLTGSFLITVSLVKLLFPYPWLLGLLLTCCALLFVLLAALGDSFRAIGFSSMIIAIYTLLDLQSPSITVSDSLWMVAGAALYMLYAFIWQLFLTHFSLRQQLSNLFYALSYYQREKARLYGVKNEQLANLRFKLAQKNQAIVAALEQCRLLLIQDEHRFNSDSQYRYWYHLYMIAQRLHESSTSSHFSNAQLREQLIGSSVAPKLRAILLQLAIESRNLAQALEKNRFFSPNGDLETQLIDLQRSLSSEDIDPVSLNSLERNLNQMVTLYRKGIFAATPDRFTIPKPQQQPLKQRLKAQLTLQSPLMRHAIRLSLCIGTGFVIARLFFNSHGFWILLTALMLCQIDFASTIRKLASRVFGTFAGVLSAGLLLPLLANPLGAVTIPSLSVTCFFLFLRTNYGIAVFFISWLAAILFHFQGSEHLVYTHYRLTETAVGALLTLTVQLLLWPDWKTRNLNQLCSDSLQSLQQYLSAIFARFSSSDETDETDYRVARRAAHTAEVRLLNTLASIQLEPRRNQKLLNALHEFTMAYHQILSYSSAIASHKQEIERNEHFNESIESLLALFEQIKTYICSAGTTQWPTQECFEQLHQQITRLLPLITGRSQLVCYQFQQIALVLEKTEPHITLLTGSARR